MQFALVDFYSDMLNVGLLIRTDKLRSILKLKYMVKLCRGVANVFKSAITKQQQIVSFSVYEFANTNWAVNRPYLLETRI